jgi:hypothetical protein
MNNRLRTCRLEPAPSGAVGLEPVLWVVVHLGRTIL